MKRRHVFEDSLQKLQSEATIKWALPGKERQDSVFNGFSEIEADSELVAIHDSARPLINADDFRRAFLPANLGSCTFLPR